MNVELTRRERIVNDFTYHAPTLNQVERYQALREEGMKLALTMHSLCPDSPELDQALFLLNLAVMSANASIARNE